MAQNLPLENGGAGGTGDAEPKPVKRTRQGKPKTKTGCITCKIRRIKCDEGKPECMKCKSTGRKCDGYSPIVSSASSTSRTSGSSTPDGQLPNAAVAADMVLSLQIPKNPFLDFPGTALEHRYLDYFHVETGPILAGIFDSRFWNALLPQIGGAEPTIRHAMVAIASMHEHIEAVGVSGDRSDRANQIAISNRRFTLLQYNKAIHHLNQRLSESCQSEEVILTCCVLFICLEFLRGNIETAISHLQSGLAILIAWRGNTSPAENNMALDFSSEPQSMADNLEQIFSRLTIQAFLCGHASLYLHPEDSRPNVVLSIPPSFSTIYEAKASMDHLSKMTLRFLRLAIPFNYDEERSSIYDLLLKARNKFQIKLAEWDAAFEAMLAKPSFHMNAQEHRAVTTLKLLAIIGKVWVGIGLTVEETSTDKYVPEFEELLRLASALNDKTANTSLIKGSNYKMSPQFTFEMGVIPPLFFVAIKCRDPAIRRTAVSLISTTLPRKEGLWDADLIQAIAERIIEIEEEGMDWSQVGKVDLATLIPEYKRVHESAIHHRSDFFDTTSRTNKVTIMMKPQGLKGPWDVWEEEATWINGKAHWKKNKWTMPMDKDGRDIWALKEAEGLFWDRPAVASLLGYDDLASLSNVIRSWNI